MQRLGLGAGAASRVRCALVLGWVGILGCAAPPPTERPWIEVQSEHFTILSSMHEANVVALAGRLEIFRAAVLVMSAVKKVEPTIPTYVYAFDSMESLRAFQPAKVAGGYVVPDLRAYYVALLDTGGTESDRIHRHEYAHFMTHNRKLLLYPRWFSEGFAEFVSTIDVLEDYAVVGIVPRDRAVQFSYTRWIPMKRILEYDGSQLWTSEDVSMFYAQSWAFVHYLLRDQAQRERFSGAMRTYMDRIDEGASVSEASKIAFGLAPHELDPVLKKYLKLKRGEFEPFGVKAAALGLSHATTTRSVGEAEVAERLGDLALHAGDVGTAEQKFAESLAQDPERARAHAGMGFVHTSRGNWDLAQAAFERAVELDADDPLNQLDMGEYWYERARRSEDSDARREWLGKARAFFTVAHELDESRPEPYAVYGASFLLPGDQDPPRAIASLENAETLLPSNLEIRLMLAEAYVLADRDDDARRRLEVIVAWGHEGPITDRARVLLDELERRDLASEPDSGL